MQSSSMLLLLLCSLYWTIFNEVQWQSQVKCCHMRPSLSPTVQQCPDPGEVVNGARSVRPEAGFAIGTVVRFSCNQGYQLEGPSQISCHGRDTGNPKWRDRSPKCVCESFPCTLLSVCLWCLWLHVYKWTENTWRVFLCALNSKVWALPKPGCPWQWLPNIVQAQLPGRRISAFLLLWGLRTYRRGHSQLRSRPALSVEQPTALLQRWTLSLSQPSYILLWTF